MTTDVHGRAHTPAGVRAGGQFATEPKPETDLSLDRPDPAWTSSSDAFAMSQIAEVLGNDEEWDGVADYLQAVAEILAATGRADPGATSDFATYCLMLDSWISRHPLADDDPHHLDYTLLNSLARTLAEADEWGADAIVEAGRTVAQSGRPGLGEGLFGDRYTAALNTWRLEHDSLGADDELSYAEQVADGADLPFMAEVYDILWNRETVAHDAWLSVTGPRVQDAFDRHFSTALDEAADEVVAMDPPAFVGPQDSLARLDAVCDEAGLEVMAVALRHLHEDGQLASRHLGSLTPGLAAALYERYIGPAVDAYERDLLATFGRPQ